MYVCMYVCICIYIYVTYVVLEYLDMLQVMPNQGKVGQAHTVSSTQDDEENLWMASGPHHS